MVGITKRQSKNTKKTGVALARNKKQQLFKKKAVKSITADFEVESMEVGTDPVVVKKAKKLSKYKQKKISMNANVPHRPTVVKPDKLNRNLLPLKPTSIPKEKKKNIGVVTAQPISKKKAKKIMKAQRHLAREKEEKEKKMQS